MKTGKMKVVGLKKAIRLMASLLLATTTIVVLGGCEDILTPVAQEAVRIAELPVRLLTVQPLTNGISSPSGQVEVKENEPLSITATVNDGYTFLYWEKLSGDGNVVFVNADSPNTEVRLTDEDAAIHAVVSTTPRTLEVTKIGDGSVTPSSTVTVGDGMARNIEAVANDAAGYTFAGWSKTGGTGSVIFGSAASASTTVTLTGGDANIQATFLIKTYAITVTNTAGGSTNAGSLTVQHGVQSDQVTATPSGGYVFTGWTVTTGSGVSFSPNATDTTIRVAATDGNATIRANFVAVYTLTMATPIEGGYTSPSGSRSVQNGAQTNITAYNYPTYRFNGWVQTAGTGTASFGNASSASTTVTVNNGNATIRANYTKETVSLVERGTYQHGDFSTVPNDALDAYMYGGYLYLVGEGVTGSGVVRRWNVASPTAPTSASNDYFYLTGIGRTITGNGTQLFIGTDSRLYRFNIADFGSSFTNNVIIDSVSDLSLDSLTSFYGIRSGNTITGYYDSLSSGDIITDSVGWGFKHVLGVPGGVVAVQEDNGAHQLAAYYALIGDTQGVTSPDSSILLHNGYDMDPGWAGKPIQDVDREYAIIPVEDKDTVASVRFYDVTALNDIQHVGSATLSKRANRLAVDTSGSNDYYVFAAAGSGDGATVYVIDMWSKSSPVVRTTLSISGFNSTDAVTVNGNYLYVVVDDPTSGTNFKPTVKVYEIVKN